MVQKHERPCALITGGAGGIGLALAKAVAGEGYRVALGGRDAARLQAAASQAGAEFPLVLDVRDPDSVEAAFGRLEAQFGRLDLLVNSAGTGRFLSLEETDEASWAAMIDTNLTGTWRVIRRAMPLLLARRGMILNVISIGGRKAYPGSSAYGASKFGMLGLAESLREEFRGRGVRIINLLPGATATRFWEDIPGSWDRSRMIQPEDIAQAALAAIRLPERALVEEIVIRPARGDL